MERIASTTSSTATSLDSDYDANEALRRVREIGPRPTPPKQRLHAEMNPLLRDIDWNGHVPTAPRGPVSMTREQLDQALAEADDDLNERWLPTIPGPRNPVDITTSWDGDIYDRPAAWTAFGSAA